ECISGGNGGTGITDSRSFAASVSRSSPHRSLPVHRRDSGACPDTRRFNTPYEIRCSTLLVSPESSCLCRFNSIEPPWYGPVCPVVWEGWRRETSPYPDLWPRSRHHRWRCLRLLSGVERTWSGASRDFSF